jgi:hypothetical protein
MTVPIGGFLPSEVLNQLVHFKAEIGVKEEYGLHSKEGK